MQRGGTLLKEDPEPPLRNPRSLQGLAQVIPRLWVSRMAAVKKLAVWLSREVGSLAMVPYNCGAPTASLLSIVSF